MTAPTLFPVEDQPRARASDPTTARAAAGGARSVIDLIRNAFVGRELTADETVALLRADGYRGPESTVKAALSRLDDAGVLERTGQTRPSMFGAAQMVRRLHSSYRPVETVTDPQGRVR